MKSVETKPVVLTGGSKVVFRLGILTIWLKAWCRHCEFAHSHLRFENKLTLAVFIRNGVRWNLNNFLCRLWADKAVLNGFIHGKNNREHIGYSQKHSHIRLWFHSFAIFTLVSNGNYIMISWIYTGGSPWIAIEKMSFLNYWMHVQLNNIVNHIPSEEPLVSQLNEFPE